MNHLLRPTPTRCAFAALICLLCGLTSRRASADARHDRLASFSDEDLALLEPLLAEGPVAFVGFAGGDDLPEISVVSYVHAPAERVAEVIASPGDYPSFMPMLDHVHVTSQQASQVAYSWRWRVGLFVLEGENRMHVQPPPSGRPDIPHRIAVFSERGHMGSGRLMWKVHRRGERSLVELSMRVDMRKANVIMQQLDAASRSINRSVNLALCYVMVLGTKREAERRAGHPDLPATGAAEPPGIDAKAVERLLRHGDLVWLSTADHPRSSIWVLGRTGVSQATMREVLVDPNTFGAGLVPGSHTKVTSKDAEGTHFEWHVGLPLVGAEGQMVLTEPEGSDAPIQVRATAGALAGGHWELQTPRVNDWEASVWAWAQFNVADAGFLIRKIAEVDPVMGHGLAAATEVMMLRALRNRAWDLAKRKRDAARAAEEARRTAPERASTATSLPSRQVHGEAPPKTPVAPKK